VSVRSTYGAGATFTLHFPVHLSAPVAAEWEAAKLAQQQRADATSLPAPAPLPFGAAMRLPPLLVPSHVPMPPTDADADADALLLGGIKRTRSPLPPSTPPAVARGGQDALAAPTAQLRCLLAEDHALNLKLVKRLLEQSAHFSVEPAVNGKEAYNKLLAAFEAGEPPHIAVLDMQARWHASACVHACMR
jgi:hypothetical protein